MSYVSQSRNPMHSVPAITGVALLHVALIYAVMNGLGHNNIPRPPPHTVMWVIPDQVLPPPPPPPVAPDIHAPALKNFVPAPVVPPTAPAGPAPHPAIGSVPPLPGRLATPANAPADTAFSPSAILGGVRAPEYPDAYIDAAKPGRVTVDCMIGTDGQPADCKILNAEGGAAFATETLRWLTGPSHPVYRPAVRGGIKQREEHRWVVTFQPPG
jgi:protein TonB